MTVSSETRKAGPYSCNGATTVFAFAFKVFAQTEVRVVLKNSSGVESDLTLTTHYTVSLNADQDVSPGGSITTVSTYATGNTITITSDVSETQGTELPSGGGWYPKVVERALDKVTILVQQTIGLATRAVRQPISDSTAIGELPTATSRASKYLAFNASGDPIAASGTPASDIVTPFMETVLDDTTSNAALTTLTATRSETGAAAVPVLTILRRVLTPEDFGAVGDGATNDLTALTNWINALNALPAAYEGRMLPKTYAVNGSLPNITASGVRIVGAGGGNRNVGSLNGSIIKAISGATGTLLTVAPVEGASAQGIKGLELLGVAFDCNNIAAKGVIFKSVASSKINIFVANATTDGITFDVATTLGEAADCQNNDIWIATRQIEAASGVGLRLKGSATANFSLNRIHSLYCIQKDGLAVIHENTDNNTWVNVSITLAGGGAATNSIEWRGGATSALSCRNEYYIGAFSTALPAIAKGTGTYTVGAQEIHINPDSFDIGNSTPTPTEETGTTVYDGRWRSTSPTVTASSGTITTVSSTLRYRRMPKAMSIGVAISVTTNGTGAGNLRLTIPVTIPNNAGSGALLAGERTDTGVAVKGLVAQNASTLVITDRNGAYPAADGANFFLAGTFETS